MILQKFQVIGISIRTTNENEQSAQDIPALWNRFMSEGVIDKIPGKINNTIYCVYTDYEKDHLKPYTTIIGCKVSSLDEIPEGLAGKTIDDALYVKYIAKGNILEGLVFKEWVKIWNSDLSRTFTTDFEVYDERAQNPESAEVDIFVAIE